jgi:hypothetical protein
MVASFIGVERHVQQHVMYNMVTSFIGVERHFQQIVESGFNSNKSDHQAIQCTLYLTHCSKWR